MGLLEKLKSIFTRKEWDGLAQDAMGKKAFVVEPFLSKLHEIEKVEASMEQDRYRQQQMSRSQQYGSPYGPSPNNTSLYGTSTYGQFGAIQNATRAKESEEREKQASFANASLAELMNAIRQQQIT